MNRLAIALQHGKGYPQEHDGAVRLHPRDRFSAGSKCATPLVDRRAVLHAVRGLHRSNVHRVSRLARSSEPALCCYRK